MGNLINKNTMLLTGILAFSLILSSCAALHTSIAKKNLEVQTKMSDTIFLDPITPDQRTIYLNFRNTSGKSNFDIAEIVATMLKEKGYLIISDPHVAHYWLQVNVLSIDKASPTAAEHALRSGYGGGAALGTAVGAATGAAIDGWPGAAIGGLVGAAALGIADTVANAAVQDVTFMVITDVEIAERVEEGVIVREDSQQDAQQGVGGARRQTSTRVTEMNRYRTRVVSTANKANLLYEEAAYELTNGLIRSITGFF
ncbi:MAG: complement resistance protein TraT [Nitrosomonas sp.]|nr:complement resistance protein TraT [Nitrosomonas sp.]MDP1951251.1 complement resistance protein TraT [Nitrosomonas sp.]